MIESLNSIRLSGRVCAEPEYDHTIYGEAFYHIKTAVERLSGAMDILPVTVSERLLGDADEHRCSLGSFIGVSGQVRSYNQTAGERSRLFVTVFARDLEFIEENDPEETEAAEGEAPAEPEYVNEVELCGAVCKPVIYRTTPFNREIADILIAVNRRYGKSDYLPCIAWGRNARFAEGLSVGDSIYIRGRMQSRAYQKTLPDGTAEQRMTYEISCSALEKQEQW